MIALGANPAQQCGAGQAALLLQLILAFGEQGRLLTRRDLVGQLTTSTGEARANRLSEQAILSPQLAKQVQFAFHRVAGDPRLGRDQAHLQRLDLACGLGAGDGGMGDFGACPTLFAVGHLLHQADHAHGHAIVVEAPALGALDRQALYAKQQFRVGQFAGGNGFAAHGLHAGRLGTQRRRVLAGQT